MGCVISYSICTKCGNKAKDESEACQHIKYEKNSTFHDGKGNARKVAELCGHEDEPDSVRFVDASWVANPAFTGAVKRNVIEVPENVMAKIEEANKVEGYKKRENDFLKAASAYLAQDKPPAGDEPPPDKPPEDEPPAEEPPAGKPPADEPPAEAPAEGAPAEAPAEPEEEPESDVQKLKKRIKQKILEEIADEFEGEKEDDTYPRELETLDENLISPTASSTFKKLWDSKRSWDQYLMRTAGALDRRSFNRLRYGSYILLTSSDLTELANYGYGRRDFLAVMSFLDNCFKNPLDPKIKKAVASLGGAQGRDPVSLLKGVVASVGRKLTKKEAKRAVLWLKLMDFYKP